MKLEIFNNDVKVNEITNQLEIILSYTEALQNKYINKGNIKLKYSYEYKNNKCYGNLVETFENKVKYVYSDIPCNGYLLDRFSIVEILKSQK